MITQSIPIQKPPNRGFRWPMFVVAMLLLNVGVCVVTVVAAVRHPVTVEPDYYDKALRWDELHELVAVAKYAQIILSPKREATGYDIVVAGLDHESISPVNISADAVREVSPGTWSDRVTLNVQPDQQGQFSTTNSFPEPGEWFVTATVTLDHSLEPIRLETMVTVPR